MRQALPLWPPPRCEIIHCVYFGDNNILILKGGKMKKMILSAVFSLGFAVAASAASVTWSANGLTGPDKVTTLSGAVAYLFVGAQDTSALVDAITGGTFTGTGALYSKQTTPTGVIAQANLGAWANEDVTYYSVWFDGPTIADSSFFRISYDVTLTFTTANLVLLFNESNGRLPADWTAVPEPTSMALLALGVAAIGLRRKTRK